MKAMNGIGCSYMCLAFVIALVGGFTNTFEQIALPAVLLGASGFLMVVFDLSIAGHVTSPPRTRRR